MDDNRLREILGSEYESFVVFQKTKWVGPFTIDEILDNCINDTFEKPPESNSVYIISRKSWIDRPSADCIPLYIGSNTSESPLFRKRIGDLLADLFGFFSRGKNAGHHSGGQTLHDYCRTNNVNPKLLYMGWLRQCGCNRCAEWYFWDLLQPELNINRPSSCNQHYGKDRYLSIIPNSHWHVPSS